MRAVGIRHEIFELRVLADEGQQEVTDRSITLLGNGNVGQSFFRRVGVVDLFAVNKHNKVCVLLDGAGLA